MEGTMSEIRWFAANFVPKNWAYCQGQTQAIAQNAALFSLLGTTYGGNGSTTFQLPNFTDRIAVGTGQGPGLSSYALGQIGGNSSVTLTQQNLPAHVHTIGGTLNVNNIQGDEGTPEGTFITLGAAGDNCFATSGGSKMNANALGVTINPAGGNQPINIMQPYIGMNFIICMYGIFPSRS
jgi:microcystin-dependent protein